MNHDDRRQLGRTLVETTVLGFGGLTIENLYPNRSVRRGDAPAVLSDIWVDELFATGLQLREGS